ncbi:hypothetical protein WAI453_008351 [Rhynchosporium graminicola]
MSLSKVSCSPACSLFRLVPELMAHASQSCPFAICSSKTRAVTGARLQSERVLKAWLSWLLRTPADMTCVTGIFGAKRTDEICIVLVVSSNGPLKPATCNCTYSYQPNVPGLVH